MRIVHFLLASSLFLLLSCAGPSTQQAEDDAQSKPSLSVEEQAFMDNLRTLCGKSFLGEETYMAEGRESWAHKKFVMHVTICEDNRIHIPFHLDDDHSRTWMFLVEDGRLRFRHDHRHPDGSPEDLTLYGGYADGAGTAFIQHFPADAYTVKILQDTLGRQWDIAMADNLSIMTYQLRYDKKLVFEASFDLLNPIQME
jgi:hypothetical protein